VEEVDGGAMREGEDEDEWLERQLRGIYVN
jgi:hypothetical protein